MNEKKLLNPNEPADFTPSQNSYETTNKVSPFRMFCYENFPFIEQDFDAITTYQLLQKIVGYLNKVIDNLNITENNLSKMGENVTSLYNAYVQLQDYVNHYFENLDIQDEINLKLDNMVLDGTFNRLITPIINDVFNPYKKVVDNRLDGMDIKINSCVSGSPAGVYESLDDLNSKNPSHDRIYITKNNGNWNYWNGTEFVSGGTYQGTSIPLNSIYYDNFSDKIKNAIQVDYDLPIDNIEIIKGQIDPDGTIQPIVPDNIRIIKKPVNPHDILYINFDFDKLSYNIEGEKTAIYGFYDGNNNLISLKTTTTSNTNKNYTENNVEVPERANYILCNLTINYIPHYVISNINIYKQKEKITYDDLGDNLKTNFKINYKKEIPSRYLIENGIFTTQGDIAKAIGYNIKQWEIKPNTMYKLSNALNTYSSNIIYAISSNQSKNEKIIDNTKYEYTTPIEIELGSFEGEKLQDYYFISPSYSITLYSVTTNKNDEIIKLFEGIPTIESENKSKLENLLCIYDGDSICEGRYDFKPNGGAYAKIIADLTNSRYNNYAISGAVLSSVIDTTLEGKKHSVYDNLINLDKTGDIYTFEGGYNDYALSIPLGEITTDYDSELNIKTVCGALEGIFRYALTNFAGKHICFILTHKVLDEAIIPNQTGKTLTDYHDSIKKVCKKYSIPVYDAFEDSGLNGFNRTQNELFLHGDGTHPNEDGYKKYYVPQIISLYNSFII